MASEGPPKQQSNKKTKGTDVAKKNGTASVETIQVVAGSYDQVLHGITVTIEDAEKAQFADTFLFNAHTSAIRCVAVSPPSAPAPGQTQKIILASGSTDQRINLYHLSAYPPSKKNQDALASLAPRPILEDSKNREVGTLLHHDSTITALRFPTRSKLLSSSEDSTIAVTRTRDWSTLSTIKAPMPKAQGRPSGDTAAVGATPAGVNDFAIHPSMKLMISVSRGERCMRLWNLVTGKKAGVLNFGRNLLQEAGEGKHATGEGRRVVWGSADGADEFAVGFDRNVVVFGMDSTPKCKVMPSPSTKVHQFCYFNLGDESAQSVMAVATEDGKIVFFSTRAEDLTTPTEESKSESKTKEPAMAVAKMLGYVGGKDSEVTGRIKDFVVIRSAQDAKRLYLVGGSSDGKIRVWRVKVGELEKALQKTQPQRVGRLLGTYDTHNRITCTTAFLMIPRPEGAEDSEDEEEDEVESELEGEQDSDDESE